MNSPFTNKPARTVSVISTNFLKQEYQKQYQLDVSKWLDTEEILVCECQETKYRFYHPFHLAGDSSFYHHLQKNNWYYMPWKWEHEMTLSYLNKKDEILEIGCGDGAFLDQLKSKGYHAKGIDLTVESVNKAKDKGLEVSNETIEDHAKNNTEKYDVICTFQVLEHISDPKSFIENALKCLKKNGKFIVCVPNNNSFIQYAPFNVLNAPPHHMGLWSDISLKNLCQIFPLKLLDLKFEPLQDQHVNWYKVTNERKWLKFKLLSWFYYRLGLSKLSLKKIKRKQNTIKGHSVFAVYESSSS